MKRIKPFNFQVRATGYAALIFIFTVLGCSMQDDSLAPLMNGSDATKAVMENTSARLIDLPGEVIHLEGLTLFDVYAIKEHVVVTSSDYNRLDCKATLTHLSGQDYVLETKEYFGDFLAREITWQVNMTPSGILNFYWPVPYPASDPSGVEFETVIQQMEFHTGYVFSGAGVNKGTVLYKGTFDGNRFYAETNLMAKQVQPGALDIYQEMHEGPIEFKCAIDLYITEE